MRAPRLTRDSEGKPFRRLLVTSKAVGLEVLVLESHGTPPYQSPAIRGAHRMGQRFQWQCAT